MFRKSRKTKTEWFRLCKKCKNSTYYSSKSGLNYALKQGRELCDSCRHTIRKKGAAYKRNCPKCCKELIYSCFITYDRQRRIDGICRSCSQEHKKLIGPFIRNCPVCQKELTYKDKRTRDRATKNNRTCLSCSISKKNRLRHQKDREKWGHITVPCFNRNACEYFDRLSEQNGWCLQHAKNGGEIYLKELGYWVDAYDKNKNVVVEFDEPKHFTKDGKLKKKDIDRMIEICNHLKCQFWRYNEKKGTLQKYEY